MVSHHRLSQFICKAQNQPPSYKEDIALYCVFFIFFLVKKGNTKDLDPPIKLRITSMTFNSSLEDPTSAYYQQTETDILNPVSIVPFDDIYNNFMNAF